MNLRIAMKRLGAPDTETEATGFQKQFEARIAQLFQAMIHDALDKFAFNFKCKGMIDSATKLHGFF